MVSTKFEVERFNGKNDFSLWRQRMRAVLVQMKVVKALEGIDKLPGTLSEQEKEDIMEMAYSTIILHLGDKVLREVAHEKTAAGIWLKLEQLYMTKTLTNRVFLKGRLFGFKMVEDKTVEDQLDDFQKIVLDLENIGVKVEDEDQAILILNSLPSAYGIFVETVKYSKETLSVEEVVAALKQKQLEAKTVVSAADGLVVHKKSKSSQNKKGPSKKDQFDSEKKKKLKCFFCHKEGHFRRDCPDRKKADSKKEQKGIEAAVAEEGEYGFAEALPVTEASPHLSWILDSGCSCHMTPHREWFEEFESGNYGSVHLGNDVQCEMLGIGSVKIRREDGSDLELKRVRYVPN